MKRPVFLVPLALIALLVGACSATSSPVQHSSVQHSSPQHSPPPASSSSHAPVTVAPTVTSAKPAAPAAGRLTVPGNLIGQTVGDARARLGKLGFTDIVVAGGQGGRVTDADKVVRVPEAGRRLAPDARVRLIGKPRSTADTGPGCGLRAVNAGTFNPNCPEYQGYLDPGRAGGRQPNSGDLQHDWGCRQGYIPKSRC